ncbi:MAG: hypothetical protein EOP88_06390 [Verrucomicrobiaceae bacterium]|nr:MAG: hypothetical protein EOP88_06390 [Verrucomicrobiaceae bacterium]
MKWNWFGAMLLGVMIGHWVFRKMPALSSSRSLEEGHRYGPSHEDSRRSEGNAAQAEEEKRRQGDWIREYRKNPMTYVSLIDGNGDLSQSALSLAGLSSSSAADVRKIYDSVVESAESEICGRISEDPENTDSSRGLYSYRIKGDSQKSAVYIDKIEKGFKDEFGATSSGVLMEGLRKAMPLGDFGRRDIGIVINKNDPPDSKSYIVVSIFDETTGFLYTTQNCSLDRFRKKYGRLLDSVLSP